MAYYLAAWVIGCFIVALFFWFIVALQLRTANASMLLETYFFALILGAVDSFLFAFFLRRVMRSLGTHSLWGWLVAGAVLFSVLMFLLAWVSTGLHGFSDVGPAHLVVTAVFGGPMALRLVGRWQIPIEGAAIAVVLCLVDRAFDRPDAPPEAKQTPA